MSPAEPTPEHPVGSVETPSDVVAQPLIEKFTLEMRLDATLTVNGNSWFKPGVSGAAHFRRLPTEEELQDAATYIQFAVIDPVISESIRMLSQQLEQERQNRR